MVHITHHQHMQITARVREFVPMRAVTGLESFLRLFIKKKKTEITITSKGFHWLKIIFNPQLVNCVGLRLAGTYHGCLRMTDHSLLPHGTALEENWWDEVGRTLSAYHDPKYPLSLGN